ncbi:CCR4-NOT transcription complex, partial [Fusarium albosuccineum]
MDDQNSTPPESSRDYPEELQHSLGKTQLTGKDAEDHVEVAMLDKITVSQEANKTPMITSRLGGFAAQCEFQVVSEDVGGPHNPNADLPRPFASEESQFQSQESFSRSTASGVSRTPRKLQQEVDKCFKKVAECIAEFEVICKRIEQTNNSAQKEVLEGYIKREIKKLQRLRDQIEIWAASNDIEDKAPLLEHWKLTETQLEKFKAVEKAMKTKAYSEDLSAAAKL